MNRRFGATCTLLFLGGVLLAPPAHAAPETPDQLKAVEKDLQNSQAEQDLLKQERVTVARDLERAQQTRVDLAKDIQDQEYDITQLETRIATLEAEANRRGSALIRRDKQMGQVLFALERLALHPADALTLTPLAPDDAVRAAILLRAAVPEIAASSVALQTELADLYRRRTEIVAQREKTAAAAAALVAKRARLDKLIQTKLARQSSVEERSANVEVRVGELARRAEDLRALFAKLAEEKAKRQEAERQARQAAAAQKRAAAEETRAKRAQAGAKAPTDTQTAESDDTPAENAAVSGRLFSKARGTLPFPAVGKLVVRYGDTGNGGQLTKGITIATRTGATVVSPYDGMVAFAGPFRGYGQLIIVEHSEGYHTLMAGMARIDTTAGQRVLAGEPVAVMAEDGEPALYVELRRDGQPINPLPWLAVRRGSDTSQQSAADRDK